MATVAACEKINQSLRIDGGTLQKGRPAMTAWARRADIEAHLATLLAVDRFKDYGPNGLQVEGRGDVRLLVSGVTASLALIEAAVAAGADAILVHHGLFWRGQDGRVTGWLKQRLAHLLVHEVSLFAYHLPLDGHAELGNNAQFGRQLGLQADGRFGEQDLGFIGSLAQPEAAADLARRVGRQLGREPVLLPGDGRPLRRLAWCTGGAQGWFEAAVAAGADAYLTGELSEPQAHLARETGVAFLACGHHATERYGAPALGEHLARQFGIEHRFIDIPNPA
jgi:dinuclear metal center YbgI/SA1388 family protein